MLNFTPVNVNFNDVYIDLSLIPSLKSFKEEMFNYILTLKEENKGELVLLFSGGMDSRFLARILIETSTPFSAVTYCFNKDRTDYDSLVSTYFCKKWGIKQEHIYIDKDELFNLIYKLKNNRVVYEVLNSYYIHYAVEKTIKDNEDRWFLTGAGSEFKIKDNFIPLPTNSYYVFKQFKNKIFNFTTDRIFLSYILNKNFMDNFENFNLDWMDIRKLIYKECFPDFCFLKKELPEDEYIREKYYGEVIKDLMITNPFMYITDTYKFDVSKFFKDNKLNEGLSYV